MTEIHAEVIEQTVNGYNDPYLNLSIGQASILQSVNIDQKRGHVEVDLKFPYPVKRFKGGFEEVLKASLSQINGVNSLEINTSWSVPFSQAQRQTASSEGQAAPQVPKVKGVKNIIAVASGKGGVGKSTTSVNLALAMAQEGARVGLLDADIYGPSQGMMLGVEGGTRPSIHGQQFMIPIEAHGIQSMSMSYLVNDDTPMIWRGPMVTSALQQMLNQTYWQDVDYLIVDMPPGTGDIALTLAQKVPVTGAVVVTTPQNIALLDAVKGIEMFQKVSVPILGIIENMSTHICSQCGHEDPIFGDGGGQHVSQRYEVPLLGQLPLDATIRLQTDAGQPTVAADPESDVSLRYLEIARKVMADLALRAGISDFDVPSIEIADD